MRTRSMVLSLLAFALPAALLAQPAAPAADTGKAEYLAAYDEVATKIKQLAGAIPDAKYGWSPAKEVRTVGQVVGHVAGAQYLFMRTAGMAVPADAPKDENGIENLKSKAEYVAAIDKALAFARQCAADATPEQLAKKVNFFGSDTTGRGLFLFMYGHMSEHLGQLIAYARSVGVTPPWSK
jgi:uncharacterized damage-inducible protein DinB